MKNLRISHVLPALYLGICCMLYSCSQDEFESVAENKEVDFTVRVKNGYLEFKDQKALEEVKTQLEGKSREELDAWESQFSGFISLRSLDEQSVDAQEKWFEELRNMSKEDRELLAAGDDDFWYSDFIKEHASAFILEDSGMYELNTTGVGLDMLSMLNKDGIVKIDGKLYMHKSNIIKVIEDGDESKIPLLSKVNESDDKAQIFVYSNILQPHFLELETNARQNFGPLSSNGNTTDVCENRNGKDRVTGDIIVERVPAGGSKYTTHVYILATNWYKDGLFGGYTRKRTSELTIEGSFDVSNTYDYTGETVVVDADTGGNTVTRLGGNFWVGYVVAQFYTVTASGDIIIGGRNNTECGDVTYTPVNSDQPWH